MDHVPSDLLLMLLADARLPVAGHTQSAGLEGAVQHGLTSAEVPLYISARLATTVRVEAGTAVVALHHLTHALPLEPVVAAWAARTPSHALRRASRMQGRAMSRLTTRLWPDEEPVRRVARLDGCPRAVALAGAAAAAGLDADGPGPARRLRRRPDRRLRVAQAAPPRPGRDHRVGARRPARGGSGSPRPWPGSPIPATSRRPPHPRPRCGPRPTPTAPGGCSVPDLSPARGLRLGVCGPVGTGKSSLIALLCRELAGRHVARRRHQRHLHRRGRPLPARIRRAGARADPRSRDRRVSAHGHP